MIIDRYIKSYESASLDPKVLKQPIQYLFLYLVKKQKPMLNDENQYLPQHNRSSSIKHNYSSIPMNAFSCSINVNPNHLHSTQKFNSSQLMTTREQSPKVSIEKKAPMKEEKVANLMHLIEKKEVVGRGGFGKVWRV